MEFIPALKENASGECMAEKKNASDKSTVENMFMMNVW